MSDRAQANRAKPLKSPAEKKVKKAKVKPGVPTPSVPERLAKLDPHLFGFIHSQTTPGDRRALLVLHLACAQAYQRFAYLEIGSHRGGSLQALVVDERCTDIVSIDLRPETTPDDRGKLIPYPGNSTQRMLNALRKIPEANVDKIHTIDAATPDIDPASVPATPVISFIDGEHTHEAALQDARFCRAVMQDQGCIVFHDIDIIASAASDFLEELLDDGIEAVAYPLPDQLFVVELPPARLYPTPAIQRLVGEEHDTMSSATRFLSRTADDEGEARGYVLNNWLTVGTGRKIRSRSDKQRLKEARRAAKGAG